MHGHGEEGDQPHAQSSAHGSEKGGACAKPTHKRTKSKSKVWEKVAWFTRKSRSRDTPLEGAAVADPDLAAVPLNVMELDLVPSESSTDPYPMNSSNTSSDSEQCDDLNYYPDGHHIKRSRLYPNSEVIEQNCLRPSMARALFHQLEAANQRTGCKPSKYSWARKKKHSVGVGGGAGSSAVPRRDSFHSGSFKAMLDDDDDDADAADSLGRAFSMPSKMTEKSSLCHCAACCSCTPSQRLMGACPAYARLSMSTTSLDTGLDLTSDAVCCTNPNPNPNAEEEQGDASLQPTGSRKEQKQKEKQASKIQNQFVLDLNQYKSNSLPSSYGKRCKMCNHPQAPKSHLPFAGRQPRCDVMTAGCGSSHFCQCKARVVKKLSCRVREAGSQPVHRQDRSPLYQDDVSAAEFKSRKEVFRQWFSEFSDEQKNLILKDILTECELPQIHLLSLAIEPRLHDGCPPNCQDLLTWLPQSTAVHILSFLDPVSLCRSSAVCQSWYAMANDQRLWRRFSCQRKWRLSRAGEQKQLIQHMLPNGNIHWKCVFSERYRLRHNWLTGKCNVRTFEGHTQGISCVQFDDTRIVSGSSDKTIKVWNIRTNTPWSVQTLVGHSGTVRCLHLEGNRLVSGSTDKTIKVWDLSTQQSWSSIACKVTMVGHLDTVRCLQVDDEKVISGSYDCTLKVWDVRTGMCRMTLRGHDAAVLCVQFDETKIVSGSCDKTIKVWTFSGDCVMTLHGHHDAVTCLQFDATLIVSGSLDCNLKFWDLHTGRCNNTIDWKASEGHTGVVRCLQADSWRVVSASDDRTLKVWSLETGQRLVTLRNHTDGVTCLQYNDNFIVSGSYDKSVKLWDFSSC